MFYSFRSNHLEAQNSALVETKSSHSKVPASQNYDIGHRTRSMNVHGSDFEINDEGIIIPHNNLDPKEIQDHTSSSFVPEMKKINHDKDKTGKM
jgi:hypothetical protein